MIDSLIFYITAKTQSYFSGSLLKNKADIRSLDFVFLYFIFIGLRWIYFPFGDIYGKVSIVLLLCFWSFIYAEIIHNTIHCPPEGPDHDWIEEVWETEDKNNVSFGVD